MSMLRMLAFARLPLLQSRAVKIVAKHRSAQSVRRLLAVSIRIKRSKITPDTGLLAASAIDMDS